MEKVNEVMEDAPRTDTAGGTARPALSVAVLGASAKPERYSNQAVRLLKQQGYAVYPVHPALSQIDGLRVYGRLSDVPAVLDTITVYLSPERSGALREEILRAKPRRLIFNPGAENPVLAEALERAGIEVLQACTLVMLKTGQFGGPEMPGPLRSCAACVPCFLRQAEEALALTGKRPENQAGLLGEISEMARSGSRGANPPLVSQRIQRLIRDRTGCADPYRGMKAELNRAALALLPELKRRIPEGMTAREAAVRMAIGGNILDAGAKSGMQLEGAMRALVDLFQQPLKGDWAELFAEAERAASILYLADNAGEIVLDRCLIECLPPGKVTVAVRGRPILNDATMEDAETAGLRTWAAIISNGADIPGTVVEECSPEFREVYEKSALIIAKGQGNYETLSAAAKPIFFLFQVKCQVVAEMVGEPVGTLLILKNKRRRP